MSSDVVLGFSKGRDVLDQLSGKGDTKPIPASEGGPTYCGPETLHFIPAQNVALLSDGSSFPRNEALKPIVITPPLVTRNLRSGSSIELGFTRPDEGLYQRSRSAPPYSRRFSRSLTRPMSPWQLFRVMTKGRTSASHPRRSRKSRRRSQPVPLQDSLVRTPKHACTQTVNLPVPLLIRSHKHYVATIKKRAYGQRHPSRSGIGTPPAKPLSWRDAYVQKQRMLMYAFPEHFATLHLGESANDSELFRGMSPLRRPPSVQAPPLSVHDESMYSCGYRQSTFGTCFLSMTEQYTTYDDEDFSGDSRSSSCGAMRLASPSSSCAPSPIPSNRTDSTSASGAEEKAVESEDEENAMMNSSIDHYGSAEGEDAQDDWACAHDAYADAEESMTSSENAEEEEAYFPPWRYMRQLCAPPVDIFPEDGVPDEAAHASPSTSGVAAPRSTSVVQELREAKFIFQQGDIVCCGLSHKATGPLEAMNHVMLSLVAYVSCPVKQAGVGVKWKDTVTHAGFISQGGTVDTAEMAHNRSNGLECSSLLQYLENCSTSIWVIRSPVLANENNLPHRVYTYVERSIFEAMLDRYALHSAWMKAYLPPTDPDKYNFSFLLSFLSLYSEALRRELEHRPHLGAELGEPCSVWRHVMPFGELIAFPPLHALLGGEGAYCSLSVAQFFHDCLSVHCDVDPAVKQTPSLSPFYLGLEPHINKLIDGLDLRDNDGIHFKILSPYTLEILRRLAHLEEDANGIGALTRFAGIKTVVGAMVDWDADVDALDNTTALDGDALSLEEAPPTPHNSALRNGAVEAAEDVARVSDADPAIDVSVAVSELSSTTAAVRDSSKVVVLWQDVESRSERLREQLSRELTIGKLIRFSAPQVEELLQPTHKIIEDVRQLLATYADPKQAPAAQLLEDCLPALEHEYAACLERAKRMQQLSGHVFESLQLLMIKARNAILNEWVSDLHVRARPASPKLGPQRLPSPAEADAMEENRLWEEDMLRLCVRYHAELRLQHEISFMQFLIEHRETTVPALRGTFRLHTSVTLRNAQELVSSLRSVVDERMFLLQQEIKVAVQAKKTRTDVRVCVRRPFLSLPRGFEIVLTKQASLQHATRDSVLAEYLQVSRQSGLVLVDADEAQLHKRHESVFRHDDAVPSGRTASGGKAPASVPAAPSAFARSRSNYGDMFNPVAFLANKQYKEARNHYQSLYMGAQHMLPAEQIANERRDRVSFANALVDRPWAVLLVHVIFFYALAAAYANWHAHSSCMTAPLQYLTQLSTSLPTFCSLSLILATSTLLFFQPALHYCIILALVWNKIVWKSFLRAIALAVATIAIQLTHNINLLRASLRGVEWLALASMALTAYSLLTSAPTACLGDDTLPLSATTSVLQLVQALPVSDTAFTFLLWMLHCTCWALSLATHYVPISEPMVYDHLCLALPLAFLTAQQFPLQVLGRLHLFAHVLCLLAFAWFFSRDKSRATAASASNKTSQSTVHTVSSSQSEAVPAEFIVIHALSIPRSCRLAQRLVRWHHRLMTSTDEPAQPHPTASTVQPRLGCTSRMVRNLHSLFLQILAIYSISPPWLLAALSLIGQLWFVSCLFPAYPVMIMRVLIGAFTAEVVLAMYYDGLRANRYSSISILRAARDLRVSLDHDYRQQLVSGTCSPNHTEFSRSIMRGVQRYIVLPQWLRDFASENAVVFPRVEDAMGEADYEASESSVSSP